METMIIPQKIVNVVLWLMALGSLGLGLWGVDLMLTLVISRFKAGKTTRNLAVGYLKWVQKYALGLAFVIALGATGGSLFMSKVAQLPPCELCWYQRIFMYPLVPILALAIGKRDAKVVDYVLVLSILGGAIGVYQYLLQLGWMNEIASCSVTAGLADCSDNYVAYFGFMTIPLMSVITFASIGLLMVVASLNESFFRDRKTRNKSRRVN